MGVHYLSRIESFSAAHRLHSPHLSDADNKALYGPCNNPNGHGHNYKVKVTVAGKVDEETGMVMNISDLKQIMKVAIIDVCDHKHLDLDIRELAGVISTTENMCTFLWNKLSADLPAGVLYEVKLYETDKNTVCYRGGQ